jgi:Mrp family chromosome partitioning ATPase
MSAIKSPISESGLTVLDTRMHDNHDPSRLVVQPEEGKSRLVMASEPGGLAAEQYRLIRRKLVERYPDGAAVVVTSAKMGEGKTLTSANLSWCFAETGSPTLLAEMDLRRPSLTKLLGYSPQVASIASLLEGDAINAKVYRINSMPLYVAMSDARRDTSSLLSTARVSRFLSWAKQHYKWVVLDSPPLFPFSDTAELSAAADFTILVVRAGLSTRNLVARSVQVLGSQLQQVILNDATECLDSPYRYLCAQYGTKKPY